MFGHTLLALFISSVPQQVDTKPIPALCSPSSTVSIEFPSEAIEADKSFFSSTIIGSYGELQILNKLEDPVVALTMLVDYYGPSGTKLLTITFAAVAPKQIWDRDSRLHPENLNRLTRPLRKNGRVTLVGLTAVATPICPVRAAVTSLQLAFSNGRAFRWAHPQWSSPATVHDAPFFANEPPPMAEGCLEGSLNITADGKLQDFAGIESPDEDAERYLNDEITRWSFNPALIDGYPAASQIHSLVCFSTTSGAPSQLAIPIRTPLTVFVFYPSKKAKGRWEALVGNMPASNRRTPD